MTSVSAIRLWGRPPATQSACATAPRQFYGTVGVSKSFCRLFPQPDVVPHNRSLPGKYTRLLLLVYGLLNAALYSSLLPLWEGFDEEFHYGYVQYLGAHHRFPVLGPTALSLEINRTIGLLPMSYVMIENLHLKGVRTFDQYFALPGDARHALYREAQSVPADLRLSESAEYYTNYEVHHAPLAYLLMAIPDTLMSPVPLPRRVWILRLLASAACVLLMFRGMLALGAESGLNGAFTAVVIFLTFSCQMFWATVAHIGNDWLAVPLAVWLLVFAMRRNVVWCAAMLGLGLLSKAYFLVFMPLYVLAALVWYRKRDWPVLFAIPTILAGPWYVRNLMLYGNLSGRVEETSGVTTLGALQALVSIPWLKSIPFMARGAFWMGNSSFTDFSVSTMNTLLLLLAIALALYVLQSRAHKQAVGRDVFLWAPLILFCGAMIYVTGSSYSFTKGAATAASPWYLQAVMTPLLCLAMLGCQRSGRVGRWIAMASVVLWGYILATTYVAKLFPLYGGFGGGRSTLRDIARWYLSDWPRTSDILNTSAMAPASLLVFLLVMVLAALVANIAAIVHNEHLV